MQEKDENPQAHQQLGEHGAIPGAPNGPPPGATGSDAQNCCSETSVLASVDSRTAPELESSSIPTLAKPHTAVAQPVAPLPIKIPKSKIHNPAFFPVRDLPILSSASADWIWDGYLARQVLTLLVSEPKAGKSTLIFGLMQKMLSGDPFLGRTCLCGTGRSPCFSTQKGARAAGGRDSHQPQSYDAETAPSSASNDSENNLIAADNSTGRNRPARATTPGAIYFSEEPLSTLREKAERFGLPVHGERIQFVSRRQSPNQNIDLQSALDGAVEKARAIGAGLIVFDTLSAWSGLKSDNAPAAEALMTRFRDAATASNTALLVIHHTRKDKSTARGSTVLTASADIVLMLERDPFGSRNSKLKTQNSKLAVASRFSNAPDPLFFELNADGYAVVDVKTATIRKHAAIYELLPDKPPGMTRQEIGNRTGLSRWRVYCAFRELLLVAAVVSSGSGAASDPERFVRSE